MATLRLQVPKRVHFELVGRGGAVVQRIQTQFNVKMRVPNKDEPSNEVTLIGAPDRVEAAKHEIMKILGFQVGTDALVLMQLDIPEDMYGAIIGRGGSTLKDLQTRHSVSIDMPRGHKSPDDHVKIEGSRAGVTGAKADIDRLLHTTVRIVTKDGADVVEQALTPHVQLDLTSRPINEAIFFPDESDRNFARFITFLQSSKRTLDVCVFTITDDRISNTLEELHRSGVRVRVITDNDTSVQEGSDIDKFRKVGIPVKMDKSPHHMHHKFAVIDGVCLINGSFNWTRSASVNNCENVMITNSADFVRLFSVQFEGMWNDRLRFE